MVTISKLAERFALSRSTLLYYDRIGLLRPQTRSPSGYRLYGPAEIDRLETICSYRNAGLTLDEIKRLLERPGRPDEQILRHRFAQLDQEIGRLRAQQQAIVAVLQKLGTTESLGAIDKSTWVDILRSCGLSEADMRRWHEQFEQDAPAAHHAFLLWLGISETETEQIRARSRRTPRTCG